MENKKASNETTWGALARSKTWLVRV